MIPFILWTLVVSLLGWAAFLILFWLFPHLSDRGYGLAKPAGLLLFGYFYWLLATFQILPNNWTGVAASFLLVGLAGFLAGHKVGWQRLKTWFSDNQWLVIVTEILFILLFAFFALVRAAYPDITGTEKPMELAFINSILRSSTFPPADPWLSGYAISYYYFGYVVAAGIIRLTGTISGVGFNLAIALWFAMAGIGAFSLVLNILARMNKPGDGKNSEVSIIKKAGWALLGPVFLIFSANWEGLLELLHAKGVFWNADGQSAFWKWLDVLELTTKPYLPPDWLPARPPGGIWWWRASRVLQDYDLAGNSREIIDEFPFFSLYLADLHPHILSMPFLILACGLALELFLLARSGKSFRPGWFNVLQRWFWRDRTSQLPAEALMPPVLFWAAALLLGGLSFLNTWDFPIGVGLCSAAIVLGRYLSHGWSGERIIEFLESGIAFGAAGVVLYLPFYVGFASQAGGILPSLAFFTRGTHQWIMFGVMFVPIFAGIFVTLRGEGLVNCFRLGYRKALLLIAGLWAAMLVLGFLFTSVSGFIGLINPSLEIPISAAAGQFFNLQGSDIVRDVLLVTSLNRLVSPGAWLTLLVLLTLVWGAVLWYRKTEKEKFADIDQEILGEAIEPELNTLPFVFLLVAIGIGLVLFPEFFYLRDQFGWRMNTIFKFYFQTWIFWAMAAAVFSYVLWNWQRGWMKWVTGIVFILSMLAAMLYPFYGLNARFNGISIRNLTLDGNAYFSSGYPDDTAAINFLMRSPDGVVAEAVGGSYTGYARVSTQSGQPTVIGWPGHESQWRGGAVEIGNREPDIRTLYQTNDWLEALNIIQKYQIRYIYLGNLEKSTYRVDEAKFKSNLFPAFQNSSVTIYKVSDQLLTKSPSS